MPVSYSIDKKLGLLTVVGSGTVTAEDLSACRDSLRSEPELQYVTRELSDFRDSSHLKWRSRLRQPSGQS